jgi:hypothetical protein
MDDTRIGEKIVSEGKGFTSFTTVSGGKASLKAGEHELKLEIVGDWIDIDNIEFKAVQSDEPPSGIDAIRLSMTEAESNFNLFDMQGKHVASFKASGMDAAVRMIKEGVKGIRRGVYLVRSAGKMGIKQKVVTYEK